MHRQGEQTCPCMKTTHPRNRKKFPWTLILVGLLCLGLGGRGAYWVINDSRQGLASLGWRQTTGLVLRTGIEMSSGVRGVVEYSPKVAYRYAVAGQEYENDRISFPKRRGSGEKAYYQRQLDGRYPVGQPCTVYYNPRDPAESCLEPGMNVFFLVMIGTVSALLLCAGLVCGARCINWFRSPLGSHHA